MELGYLIDKDPEHIRSCMNKNYFTAVFMAQAMLRIWVDGQKGSKGGSDGKPRTRHLVFTCSVAAFVGVPGYIAYTRVSLPSPSPYYRMRLNPNTQL